MEFEPTIIHVASATVGKACSQSNSDCTVMIACKRLNFIKLPTKGDRDQNQMKESKELMKERQLLLPVKQC